MTNLHTVISTIRTLVEPIKSADWVAGEMGGSDPDDTTAYVRSSECSSLDCMMHGPDVAIVSDYEQIAKYIAAVGPANITKLLQYLDFLRDRVGYSVEVWTPAGNKWFDLSEEQFFEYSENNNKYEAKLLGMTEEEYAGYLSHDGNALCGAKTKKGDPCRNIIRGGYQLGHKDWLIKHRQCLCASHEKQSDA